MDAGVIEGALVMRDLATAVLKRVEQSLGEFDAKFKSSADQAKQASDRIAASSKAMSDAFASNLQDAGKSLTSIGKNLTMYVSAPLVAAGIGVVAFAQKFESEMTKVETLAGVNRAQVAAWKDDVLAMSDALGRSPADLAHGLLVVTSAGERGAEAMNILNESAKASAIGLGDTGTIARAVTAAMQAYGAENLSAAKATSTLIATVVEGNVEADELAGTLGRVIGIASQVGVSFQEVGAFLATFTRLGVDSAEATTALRGMLATLMKPSQGAREQLQALGTSVDELRQKVKEKGLTQAMIELAGRVGDNVDAVAEIIPNIRALSGFMGTAGVQGENFAKIIGNINAAANDANYTNEKFARTAETLAFKWEALKAKLASVATELGTSLLPLMERLLDKGIRPALDVVGKLAEGFGKLPTPIQDVAFAVGGLLIVLGPMTFMLGKLFTLLGGSALATGAKGLAGALSQLSTMVGYAGWEGFTFQMGSWISKFGLLLRAIPGVSSALALLTNPITAIVLAIAALTYAVYKFTGSWTATFKILLPPIGWLMDAWQRFSAEWAKADGLFAPVKAILSDLAVVIGDKLARAWEWLLQVWQRVQDGLAELKKQWEAFKVALTDFGAYLAGQFSGEWAKWVGEIVAATPMLRDFATLIGMVSGKGVEWRKELKDQADAIRNFRTAAAGKDIKLGVDWTALASGASYGAASLDAMASSAQAAGTASAQGAVGVKSLSAQMAEAEAKIKALTAEQRANIEAGFKLGKSEADIAQAMNLSQSVVDLYKTKMAAATQESKNAGSQMRELASKATEMTASFMGLSKIADGGASMTAWLAENSDAVLKLNLNMKALGVEGSAAFKQLVREAVDTQNALALKGIGEVQREFMKDLIKAEKEKLQVRQDAMVEALAMMQDFETRVSDIGRSEGELRIRQVQREHKKALDDLSLRMDKTSELYQRAKAAIDEYYAHELAIAQRTSDTIVERMAAAGVLTRAALFQTAIEAIEDFENMRASGEFTAQAIADAFVRSNQASAAARGQSAGAMQAVAAGFQQLGQVTQGSMGPVLSGFGAVATGLAQAQQANIDWTGSVNKGFGIANPLFSASATSAQKWAAGFQSAGAIVGGAMETWSAATSTTSKSMNTLKGAMAGAKAGAVFGPWGMAIGGVAGALAGLFGKGDQKRLNDMRDQFVANAGGIDKLNKAASDAGVSLDKLLKARSEKDLKAAMAEIEKAIADVQKRVKELVEDLGKLTVTGGLISKGLVERLKKDKNNPEVIAAFTEFLNSNIQRGVDGITAWIAIKKGITERAVALMKEGTSASEAEAAKLHRIFGITGKAASAMGDALAGSYVAMIEAGMSASEAFAKLKDDILFVRGELQDANLPASAAFQMLSDMAVLAADSIAGPAVDSINALGSSLVGLANAGILNQGMFAGLTDQITTTFNALVAEGYNGEAAMNLIQPSLQKIWELQQQFGYETDAATQKLIDQAVEAGKVGAAHMSAADRTAAAMERVATILERMATAMGVTLPNAAADGARRVDEAWSRVDPRVPAPWEDWPNAPDLPEYGGGGGYAKGGVVYAAEGWFKKRGTDTVPAMLTPGERVLTVQQNRDFEAMLRAASSVGDARLRDYAGASPTFATGTGASSAPPAPRAPAPPSAPAPPIVINIQALDPVGLKKVVEAEIAPMLVSAYRRNVGGVRTDTRKELVE